MFLFRAALLFATWIIFSGQFDLLHLSLGVLSSLLIARLTGDLVLVPDGPTIFQYLRVAAAFPTYLIWLLKEIVLANFHVLYLAFHPRMKEILDPRLLQFRSEELDNEFGHYVFANSITLTPGTLTIEINNGVYTVHAISEKIALALPSPMETKIGKVFNIDG